MIWQLGTRFIGAVDKTSTMNLSSLNVDVLLHLMKFVKPVDRFNLILSGILRGFENVNKGIIPHERYSGHLTCSVSVNRIVMSTESVVLKLNRCYSGAKSRLF
jgi:hypothetical protein